MADAHLYKIEAASVPTVVRDAIARELSGMLSGRFSEYPDVFAEDLYEQSCDTLAAQGVSEPSSQDPVYEVLAASDDILPKEGEQ